MTSSCRWEQKLESPFPIGSGERAWLCHELGYCYIEIEAFDRARTCGEQSLDAAIAAQDKQWQLNARTLIAQSQRESDMNPFQAAIHSHTCTCLQGAKDAEQEIKIRVFQGPHSPTSSNERESGFSA